MADKWSQVIAHRGASASAPENSLAAFRLAWEQGVDGVECDIRLSADGQIICLHDADTGRVGDRSLVAAKTSYADLAQVQLLPLSAGAQQYEKIPLLQTLLEQKPADSHLFVEVKTGASIIAQLIQLLVQLGTGLSTITVIAFDPEVVRAVKCLCPQLRAYCLLTQKNPFITPTLFDSNGLGCYLSDCRADGLGCEHGTILDLKRVEALTSLGYSISVWTVDDVDEAIHLSKMGVHSVTSNRPLLCYKALHESL